jgi:hypothetical protein
VFIRLIGVKKGRKPSRGCKKWEMNARQKESVCIFYTHTYTIHSLMITIMILIDISTYMLIFYKYEHC